MKIYIAGDTGLWDALYMWVLSQDDPCLLVAKDSIPQVTRDEILRLAPTGIVVLGGTARVSLNVEAELNVYAPTTRIAGSSKYSTAVAVSQTKYPVTVEPPIEPPVEPPSGMFIPAFDGNPGVGLTNESVLTDYTGSSAIPLGDYRDKIFTGQKTSYHASTFTNCKFMSGSNHSILQRSGRATFTDCEFGGVGTSRQIYAAGGTYTLIRCDISQAEDGVKWANGMHMTMCHIHDLNPYPGSSDPHADGVQAEGTMSPDTLIEYCHIDARRSDPLINGNAAIFVKSDLGNQDGGIIDNNYLNGGNYTMSLRTDGTKYTLTGMVVTNNIFGPDFRYGHKRIDSGTYSEWSGNVDTDGVTV